MKTFLSSLLIGALLGPLANAGVLVVGSLARTAAVKPGDSFEGVIFLKNADKIPAEARVYQADYLCHADGSNTYGEPGTDARSNAGWITLSPTRVKLNPGETVPVRYKGKTPADPKLRGTYWSMVMVEPTNAPVPAAPGKETEVSMGLQTLIRYAVQIVTEVGSSGTRSLQVLDKSLVKKDGKRALHLDIGNNGERLLVTTISIELFDQGGASIGRFDGGRPRIYPACSVRAKADLSDVPAGKYVAMLLFDSGDEQVMGAQYELVLEP